MRAGGVATERDHTDGRQLSVKAICQSTACGCRGAGGWLAAAAAAVAAAAATAVAAAVATAAAVAAAVAAGGRAQLVAGFPFRGSGF